MKTFFKIIFPLMFIFSCSNVQEGNSNVADEENISANEPSKKWADTTADFTKFYKGNISGKYEIEMLLSKGGEYYTGLYKHIGKTEFLNIAGSIDSTGKIFLQEFNVKNKPTGAFSGQLEKDSFNGNWAQFMDSPQLKFELKEYKGGDFFPKDLNFISNSIVDTLFSNRKVKYPRIKIFEHPEIAKRINAAIYPSDSCISEYEYCRYKSYFQVIIQYDCYKFLQYSKLIFDLRTGNRIKGIDVFIPEKREQLLSVILKKMQEIYDEQNAGECINGAPRPEIIGWKEIGVVIYKDGIGFEYTFGYPIVCNAYENGSCLLNWNELKNYLENTTEKGEQSWADPLILNYIKKSNNELINLALKNKINEEWILDRVETNKNEKYFIFKIGHDVSDEGNTNLRFVTDSWLYIDSLSQNIYEYDLPKDKLILWKK